MKKMWKKMKKTVAAGLAAVMVLGLAGCGNSNSDIDIDPVALADDMKASVTFQDQLSEVELDKVLSLYGIDSGIVDSGKAYLSTNATAEEIAVIKAKTAEDVDTVKTAVQNRVASQLQSFESYNANEVPKLENPVIETAGTCVILCVCDDKGEAEAVIDSYTAAK